MSRPKKPKPIASLEIKWGTGYYRTSIEAGADLKLDQTAFVADFCKIVNAILKREGINAPEIGPVNLSQAKNE